MTNSLTVGALIKRHIKMRGRTTKEIAEALGRPYTTFCGILNRDVVDANLLFELANLLDIDLAWMSQLFDRHKPISSLAPYQMPRMQHDFRKHDYPEVCRQLDYCIQDNPHSIADARKELIRIYSNLFYILDVLLPEDDVIRVTVERGKETFYCIPMQKSREIAPHSRGRVFQEIYEGNEMLNQLIIARKEGLL